ncbi:MAG: hypothetical protein PVJ69_16080, partial [Desulfobacteraceae bacterium]
GNLQSPVIATPDPVGGKQSLEILPPHCHSGRAHKPAPYLIRGLPRTRYGGGRDPESRKTTANQITLDLPPNSAGDDEMRHSLWRDGIKRWLKKDCTLQITRGSPDQVVLVV